MFVEQHWYACVNVSTFYMFLYHRFIGDTIPFQINFRLVGIGDGYAGQH